MSRKICIFSLVGVVVVSCVISICVAKCCMKKHFREYLLENPEIVKEALDLSFAKEEKERMKAMVAKIDENRKALEQDPSDPVLGNPDGDITIVEFFDYNCGYCKLMFPKIMEYFKKDGNIRYVLKDMPSLGPTSDLAAKAGLAANKQGKYLEMHTAMITHKGSLTEEDIIRYARENSLDMEQFEVDRKDASLDAILKKNRVLAGKFEFRGIPNFIIGDFISNGAMMNNELDEAVSEIRNAQ